MRPGEATETTDSFGKLFTLRCVGDLVIIRAFYVVTVFQYVTSAGTCRTGKTKYEWKYREFRPAIVDDNVFEANEWNWMFLLNSMSRSKKHMPKRLVEMTVIIVTNKTNNGFVVVHWIEVPMAKCESHVDNDAIKR